MIPQIIEEAVFAHPKLYGNWEKNFVRGVRYPLRSNISMTGIRYPDFLYASTETFWTDRYRHITRTYNASVAVIKVSGRNTSPKWYNLACFIFWIMFNFASSHRKLPYFLVQVLYHTYLTNWVQLKVHLAFKYSQKMGGIIKTSWYTIWKGFWIQAT